MLHWLFRKRTAAALPRRSDLPAPELRAAIEDAAGRVQRRRDAAAADTALARLLDAHIRKGR